MAGRRRAGFGRELTRVRSALRLLDASLRGLARAVATPRLLSAETKAATTRRRIKMSPVRLKALRLHGGYLGTIRQLKPMQRAGVKAVREKKGVEAAIRKAKQLAKIVLPG